MPKITKKKTKPLILGYCMKCKETSRMRGGSKSTMKNGRLAYKGTCWECGCNMHKILSADDLEKLGK